MTINTSSGRQNAMATSADEPFLILLEITHADLAVPIRVVNDSQTLVFEGNDFISCPFEIVLPDSKTDQREKASISVDNIGRELTQWLEVSQGGKGAQARIIGVLRSDPSTAEFDFTMDMTGISIDNLIVSATLDYQNTFDQAAVAIRYDPLTTPGGW